MAIIKTERHGAIAVLILDRPETMNALGALGDGDAIAAACAEINADPAVRCAILTGSGKCFSAGGDVKAMREGTGNFSGGAVQIREGYRSNIHRAARALFGLDMPLIAAVNGPAIGLGCDVACMADVRLASDKAKFGVTFLKLGLVPGDGGTWLLPRTIGMSRAAELFFTGDTIDAETACEWGLVSRVVPHETLMDEALALAGKIAAMPPHALRMTKSMLRQGQTITYDTALELAAVMQSVSHLTKDHKEGVAALLEKRSPNFSGS
ncbi:crotonase/enoyl-CoA hydratase family protein [Sphingopyxis chilensis]|jgi:enoyl-CoA hydratase/carnithine racemase